MWWPVPPRTADFEAPTASIPPPPMPPTLRRDAPGREGACAASHDILEALSGRARREVWKKTKEERGRVIFECLSLSLSLSLYSQEGSCPVLPCCQRRMACVSMRSPA